MNRGVRIAKLVALGIVGIAVFGWLFMLLWNWLVPVIFNGPVLNFWQALGLILLSKMLLMPFGKSHHSQHNRWRSGWKEKWANMSEEEKAAFKQKMRDKCGW